WGRPSPSARRLRQRSDPPAKVPPRPCSADESSTPLAAFAPSADKSARPSAAAGRRTALNRLTRSPQPAAPPSPTRLRLGHSKCMITPRHMRFDTRLTFSLSVRQPRYERHLPSHVHPEHRDRRRRRRPPRTLLRPV